MANQENFGRSALRTAYVVSEARGEAVRRMNSVSCLMRSEFISICILTDSLSKTQVDIATVTALVRTGTDYPLGLILRA